MKIEYTYVMYVIVVVLVTVMRSGIDVGEDDVIGGYKLSTTGLCYNSDISYSRVIKAKKRLIETWYLCCWRPVSATWRCKHSRDRNRRLGHRTSLRWLMVVDKIRAKWIYKISWKIFQNVDSCVNLLVKVCLCNFDEC